MKKFFSLFLAALMLLAIVPAYGIVAEEAHVEGTPTPTPIPKHDHVLRAADTITKPAGWKYYNSTHHVRKYRHTCPCVICGKAIIWFTTGEYPATAENHSYHFDSATCNGKMQTHVYECGPCLDRYNKMVLCPGGPHSGVCGYLPRLPQ